jgi:2,5-diamino-6-(ribosylamino)-4(3H)-pyrimidinone 5'-phosphate reductase
MSLRSKEVTMPPLHRPHIIAHVAITVDGATTGFEPRVAKFYELITTWSEDVTLVGADTILAQEPALTTAPRPGPAPDGPLLAVVDGRSRVREWEALREAGYWSDVVALRCTSSPTSGRELPVRQLVCGEDRVDLAAVVDQLGHEGARQVRVDSGGALIGALLDRGLVEELSLLVHPIVVGAGARYWNGRASITPTEFDLMAADVVDGDLVWLRYGRRGAEESLRR